jgi:hypothetical protein
MLDVFISDGSILVASDFFTSPGGAKFESLTWLIQLEGGCERKVYRYERGFKLLSFHSDQCKLYI